MFRFHFSYFVILISLLLVEVLIAVFLHDDFIRPFVGDFLSSIVVFYFIKSFFNLDNFRAAMISLLFSYFIEALQFVHFLQFSGLKKYKIIAIMLGNSFSWGDMLAYTLGVWAVYLIQKRWFRLYEA